MIDILIQKKIKSLPKNIQESIQNFDWVGVLPTIIRNHHLHIDKISTYKQELLLSLLGMTPRRGLGSSLQKQLNISEEQAEQLVKESNESIFKVIQKNAFTHKKTALLDDTDITRQNNSLQNLTDNLLDVAPRNVFTEMETKAISTEPRVQYNEPIELSDLAGITEHRTPYTYHKIKPISENNLSKKLYSKNFISKGDSFNASPNTKEQTLEDGDFFKHIGPNKTPTNISL